MRSFALSAAARSIVRGGFVASIAASVVSFAGAIAAALVAAVVAAAVVAAPAHAASISGTVTGPDGAPLRAAFVQARHGKLKMTVSVLTDAAGRYAVENLPAGDGAKTNATTRNDTDNAATDATTPARTIARAAAVLDNDRMAFPRVGLV